MKIGLVFEGEVNAFNCLLIKCFRRQKCSICLMSIFCENGEGSVFENRFIISSQVSSHRETLYLNYIKFDVSNTAIDNPKITNKKDVFLMMNICQKMCIILQWSMILFHLIIFIGQFCDIE